MQPTTSAIWSHLSDDLRRFVRRRVVDDHVADDLVQEAFVRIHRGVAGLEDKERLVGWVYQIARNVVTDYYRKSAYQPASLEGIDATDEADERLPLPARAEQWFGELIAELPQPYRDAVQLAEIEGLSQQEVADRLGLSLSGAKSRIQRGRVLLKDILDQCCSFEFDRRGNLRECEPKPDLTMCRDCDAS